MAPPLGKLPRGWLPLGTGHEDAKGASFSRSAQSVPKWAPGARAGKVAVATVVTGRL
jgi:hypothetical protein